MKIVEQLKKELFDFNKFEALILVFTFVLIFFNAIVMKDSLAVIVSAVCGILYTMTAGKGKFYCYLIGLCGSGCYSYIAFKSALFGNCLLYLCYYIPLQVIGFFSWKKHLKSASLEVVKVRLPLKERLLVGLVFLLGTAVVYGVLRYFHGSNPLIDAITTFGSIIGMYLTVKRATEQWVLWFIVNLLSFIMWLNLTIQGTKAYSTLVMWFVYTVLAVYFYIIWAKELSQNSDSACDITAHENSVSSYQKS